MTANLSVQADLAPPFASQPADAFNTASAGLPSLRAYLQVSPGTFAIGAGAIATLYDRKARVYWTTPGAVAPATLGPQLFAVQGNTRYGLAWPAATGFNPLRGPASLVLPAVGSIALVVDLASYTVATTIWQSLTTTGNYLRVAINGAGQVEVTGAAGAVLARSAVITPYAGTLLIILSWSGTITRVSTNGSLAGGTTSGAYIPNGDALELGTGLNNGSKVYAALVMDVDFHASTYDAQRAAWVIEAGKAFGFPFTIAWTYADLGLKRWFDVDPSTVADGNVTTVTDGASGVAMTEATFGPSKASADLAGKASFTFVSANTDRLRNTAIGAVWPVGGAESQLFFVGNITAVLADTTEQTIFGYGAVGSLTGRSIRRVSTGTAQYFRATANNAGQHADFPTVDATGLHVVEGEWKAGMERIRVDGTLGAQVVVAFNTTQARAALGCSPNNSAAGAFADCQGGRFLGTTGITTDDRDRITGRLAFDFGIQSKLPDGHPYKKAIFTP